MANSGRLESAYGGTSDAGASGKARVISVYAPRLSPMWLIVPASILAFLLVWELAVRSGYFPPYILPSPARVAARFVSALRDGTWWRHTSVTLSESLLGFALGFVVQKQRELSAKLARAFNYLLPMTPIYEQYGTNVELHGVRSPDGRRRAIRSTRTRQTASTPSRCCG